MFTTRWFFAISLILLSWPTVTTGRLRRHHNDVDLLETQRYAKRASHKSQGGDVDGWKSSGHSKERKLEPTSRKDAATNYHILTSQEIKQQLMLWKTQYPSFCRVTTAQQAYGLPVAGGPSNCPFENGTGCVQYIVTVQDYVAHPIGSNSSNRLPEVYWSGALHGDERVGPTAVMEAGALLLAAANCEAQTKTKSIRACQAALLQQGIDHVQRRWLARLVLTRRIVIVPTANALGYYQNVRTELGVDVNRDFPYDIYQSTNCMKSIAARAINEIWREHLFQMSLTFHAGMEVIGYEWGAPSWFYRQSPDDQAQNQIAAGYSRYAGTFPSDTPYVYGDMNALVYFVEGGMEDWAYAGSWTPANVITCGPTTYGGYPASKTKYNNSTLRAFNMLVETSGAKTPSDSILGSSNNILTATTGSTNGHIARNIRLSLLSVELVEPYVSIVGVDQVPFVDMFPLTARRGSLTNCLSKKILLYSNSSYVRNNQVQVKWTVGGGFQVDRTNLYYAVLNDALLKQLYCWGQPSSRLLSQFLPGSVVSSSNGTTFFSNSGPRPAPSSSDAIFYSVRGPWFQGTLDTSAIQGGQTLVILASAQLDQSWAFQPTNIAPKLTPQSHMVNARTNPGWYHESAGKVIQGRREWFSPPLLVSLPLSPVPR